MSTIIKFEDISKQYRLGSVNTGTLKHDLNRWWAMNIRGKEDPYLKIGEVNNRATKGISEYVWALKNIDFEVEQGDVLGIIGKNGAGKSTLLKILSRVTSPSTGSIKSNGRIASLLEVGTGFHPELTGRDNIYMNGAILGMSKQEISRKLDEIVDFSGIERYLDTPTKRYSSGMTVRLGFAIAAHLDPEILVVDEVLAVGDAEFQKKAIGKMQDVSKGDGRTVLFVSHNMASVRSLCNKGIVLENGSVAYNSDSIDKAINYYLDKNTNQNRNDLNKNLQIVSPKIKNLKVLVNDSISGIININSNDRKIKIHVDGYANENIRIAPELRVREHDESLIATFAPAQMTGLLKECKKGDFSLDYEFSFPKNLTMGTYYMSIAFREPGAEIYTQGLKAVEINVEGLISKTGHHFGKKDYGFFILD